ncbi:hypothetical protein [Legionella sp.]|uniref:hypothetical protein n=1 Tax=Legionella sp. TaxID=459 RepID=UPI003CA81B0F
MIRSPLTNQNEFKQFYEKKAQIDVIADYSTKLMAVLNKTIHAYNGKKTDYKAPALVWWRIGKFEQILEHEEIRRFIMESTAC